MSVFFKILEETILAMLIVQTQASSLLKEECLKVIFINLTWSAIVLVLYTKH